MHYLYFVLIQNDKGMNSIEAREQACEELLEHSFVYNEGFFSTGVCDWFVIGGRWSAFLTPVFRDFYAKARKLLQDEGEMINPLWISSSVIKKNKEILQSLWEKEGGNDLNSFIRDSYQHYGYEDDAKIFNTETLNYLKSERKEITDCKIFIPSKREELKVPELIKHAKSYIGKYWLVVIDYHN